MKKKQSNEKLLTHATMHDVSSAVSHNLHPAAHYNGRKIIKKKNDQNFMISTHYYYLCGKKKEKKKERNLMPSFRY